MHTVDISNRTPFIALAGSLLLIFPLGWIDYLTGKDISFSLFYLIPVSITAWYTGAPAALIVSFISAGSWYMADYMNELADNRLPSSAWIPVWNATMRMFIFIIVGSILARLHGLLRLEQERRAEALNTARVKAEFLANMSHEIRTPLNALVGIADILAETSLNDTQRDFVRIFKTECDHLRWLVTDILDLSKLEANTLEVGKVAFDLQALVKGVGEIMGYRAREKGLTLTVEIKPNVPQHVLGDPNRLRQILMNLLGNAIKFTENGSVRLRVEWPNSASPELLFSVADTGIGIPPEKAAMVFRRFSQIGQNITALSNGSGLGLYIVKQIVTRMGGRVWFEGKPQSGTTFYVSLPLQSQSAMRPEIQAPSSADTQLTVKVPKQLRILLVEDYAITRKIIRQFLKPYAEQIDLAENGRAAVHLFQMNKYDLVLMDMQMPEMNGCAATRNIREWEKSRQLSPTPIIALTASALYEEKQNAIAAGCTEFLTKPITKAELIRTISRIIPCATCEIAPKTDEPRAQTSAPVVKIDPEFESLIPDFFKQIESTASLLRAALDQRDFTAVRALGHQLAGVGGTFGFTAVSQSGRAIESAADRRDAAELFQLIEQVESYLKTVEVKYE